MHVLVDCHCRLNFLYVFRCLLFLRRRREGERGRGRGLERSGPHPGVVSVDGDGEGAADGDDREIDRARSVRRCCGSRRRSGRSRIGSLVGQGEEVTARLTAALDLLLGGSSGGEARATATVSRRPQRERERTGKGAGERGEGRWGASHA